jgi:predicted transcriptional regulator
MYRKLLELLKLIKPRQPHLPQTNVSGSLPIEEVSLHAADDWYDTAKFRSDIRADLKSYYEGFRDAMRFCQGNDR